MTSEDRGDASREGPWTAVSGLKDRVLSVRQEVARRRGPLGRSIDRLGGWLSSVPFLVGMFLLHAGWVLANLPFVPWEPWDPYPFVFLATVASVEAPFIAILVLMRQEQDRHVAELREEVQLQVALVIEKEATTALRILDGLRRDAGLAMNEERLHGLEGELEPERLIEDLEARLQEADPDDHRERG